MLDGYTIDNTMGLYETKNCVALAGYLFHEVRHFYQTKTHFPDLEKETIIENKNGEIDINDPEQLNEYVNLKIEIDANAFAFIATALLYSEPSYLKVVDKISEIIDKKPYKDRIIELSKEYNEVYNLLPCGVSIEEYLYS